MTNAAYVRAEIVRRMGLDLVGPFDENEVLEAEKIRPSDVYLTGILWPIGERMGAQDDDGSSGDGEEDESPATATVVGMQRPCTMGISFATSGTSNQHRVTVQVSFGTYFHAADNGAEGQRVNRWTRRAWNFPVSIILPDAAKGEPIRLVHPELSACVELNIRSLTTSSGLLSTITLINRSKTDSDREHGEHLTLFQTHLKVIPGEGTEIIARPPAPSVMDEDEKSGQLLYRDCLEFATGHQCSASWKSHDGKVECVETDWLPSTVVPAYREDGDETFSSLLQSGFLKADTLSSVSDDELLEGLNGLTSAYRQWIADRKTEAESLDLKYRQTAVNHILRCETVCDRIEEGISALGADQKLLKAFRLSNAAMALQHSWKKDSQGNKLAPLRWRPFQLGFILLAAHSTCVPQAQGRDILDLLWFPTGGGKTEAYLAIVAMLAWYRRLSNKHPDDGAGNAAVMRYTLRLLTAQQFERASAMILACELIRRGQAHPRNGLPILGETPFSIGLWVGRDATPNDFKSALASRGNPGGSSPEQVEHCPCCGSRVRWDYLTHQENVRAYCESEGCALGTNFGYWPLHTVDDDIYSSRPTLLIGTVDKFAQLPVNENIQNLFGFGRSDSTDLIIQDELHLISGPLGTVTGLYETAFDWLLKKDGIKPKVIGSTATIRRAQEQVRALFDRESCQFPPPGLTYKNSGFAVVDDENKWKWRQYVGVTTAGRSAKFTLQAVAGSLLQSAGPSAGASDADRDGYATLLSYFNSLRELGGAIVQMLDDVPDSIELYARRRNEPGRKIGIPQELTSRVSQKEIIEILADLKRSPPDPDSVDVVLATNMVSVGVDVPRLGLMLVNGQPKTRSEYIQSTSRVGRSSFPGLVVSVLNAQKSRDRSHYETFGFWHSTIYKDVEATSVTPYASRARDRALKAVVVSMVRHGHASMLKSPDLKNAPAQHLQEVVEEIERRIASIDQRELSNVQKELDEIFMDWDAIAPVRYRFNKFRSKEAGLVQSADDHARKIAAGKIPGIAWPVMNTMRSVEPSSRFRIVEMLTNPRASAEGVNGAEADGQSPGSGKPRWRK